MRSRSSQDWIKELLNAYEDNHIDLADNILPLTYVLK